MLGNNYVIESGLEGGEEVVTNGTFSIDAAAQLNNQARMMNKTVRIRGKEEYKIKTPDYKKTVEKSLKNGLVKLADAYISLIDALVNTDKDIAKQAAIMLSRCLGELPK